MNRRTQEPIRPMYIYDRVCHRESKRREILHEYGTAPARQRYDRESAANSRRSAYQQNNVYNYQPGEAQGGTVVRETSVKALGQKILMLLGSFLSLFESVEERGKLDEILAKRQAVAWKKLVDHRWSVFITLLLIGIMALAALFIYNVIFVIDDVEISGSDLYTDTEILDSAGISTGQRLYDFDPGEVESQITFCLPMIRNVDINRDIPDTVGLTVTEDEPVFVCEIWGDRVILSAGLRVLGIVGDETSLPVLVLPSVEYSVAGRTLEFSDARNERYIRAVLSEVLASTLWTSGMVTKLDLSDQYDLTMNLDDMYILRLGGEDECEHKLKLVYKTITSDTFTYNVSARIDVRDPSKAAVNFDPSLVVE